MKNRILLSSVGFAALAGALVATPAYASEGDPEDTAAEESSDEYDLPAGRPSISISTRSAGIDTFGGINQDALLTAFDGSAQFEMTSFVNSVDYEGPSINPGIYIREDVGIENAVDVNDTQPSVVQIFQFLNEPAFGFAAGTTLLNCTGSLINPRTILTAAHCVNSAGSEDYGLPGTGAAFTMLIGTGPDTRPRLLNTLQNGATYAEGGVAASTDVIIHPSANQENGGLPFPFADIAMIAVDSPITDIPILPILLTPLTESTRVLHVGYGSFGNALSGPQPGSSLLRRVGENMLGALASFANFDDAVFPADAPNAISFGSITQPYYWTDFDWPDRDAEGFDGCDFPGDNIICQSLGDVISIDWFDGDALPREAGTAPGDSGSPLIVPDLYDRPVNIAVLSGGVSFFRNFLNSVLGFDNTYGDISFYNPIYPFFQFITENSPYKYVSAVGGDGNWSDPNHWTQDLDPAFLIDDGNGNLVNGIPEGEEAGIFEVGNSFGLILGTDISSFPEIVSPFGPQPGDPNFGSNLPESSVLLGPGSTGFVPQNTDGIVGVAFENPAQYFEVHLSRAGRTTVDIDVEIDKLVIDNPDAEFVVAGGNDFTVIQDVEQLRGGAQVDGTINAPFYILMGGELSGDGGTINTNALVNVAGLLNAGGEGGFGTLTINGDYSQTAAGGLLSEFSVGRRNTVNADEYNITGTAVLDGLLIVSTADRRPRFGTEYVALSAGAIDGMFSDIAFFSNSATLFAEARVEGNDVVVEIVARSIAGLVGQSSNLNSLGSALDNIRATNFTQFAGLFDYVDGASIQTLGSTLASLTPMNAFGQTFMANSFSHRFTGQIAQRTLGLRGGSRAAGGFTAAGNASFALAGGAPAEVGQVAMFGNASGIYRNGGQAQQGVLGNGTQGFGAFGINGLSTGEIGANAFEQAMLQQAGEMTIGADVRLSEGFSFGVAVSNIRNSELTFTGLQAQEDTSSAVAIYATYEDGGMFADGYAGTSRQEFGVDRRSSGDLRSAFENAIGQSTGSQVFGGMRLGYAFDLARVSKPGRWSAWTTSAIASAVTRRSVRATLA